MVRKIKLKPEEKNGDDNKIRDYRYVGEKRTNIPDAGLATFYKEKIERKKYEYDPHLDPQLIWAGKTEHASFEVDTVALHIHERISTKAILNTVQKKELYKQMKLFAEPDFPLDKRIEFYQHEMDWTNRLILGDSLLVMNSFLEREMMAGKVQMIYMDPPYGIRYDSNFQPTINLRNVKDGSDESITREIEQIKAYRDTWTLGVHSYLTYLRDRLSLCRDLLADTGSVFVQISDENLHHVREMMDEVFGAQNFISIISFRKKTMPLGAKYIESVSDYIVWYAKDKEKMTYHQLFLEKSVEGDPHWDSVELPDGSRRKMTPEELTNHKLLPKDAEVYRLKSLYPVGINKSGIFSFVFDGKTYSPPPGQSWLTNKEGMSRLIAARRVQPYKDGRTLQYVLKLSDYSVTPLTSLWSDTSAPSQMRFVVETNVKVVARCILMSTNPGDLVLDPTCGSGTTAYVAEQYGRRWVTCDTSRVALALARQRILCAVFSYYELAYPQKGVAGGFAYEMVPHITLESITQEEPSQTETLYDRPIVQHDKIRVSGPFTVEAIPVPSTENQSLSSASNAKTSGEDSSVNLAGDYVNTMISLVRKDGVTFPGGKHMSLESIRPIESAGFLHSEAQAEQNGDHSRVALSFGPRHGPVTARQVEEAVRSAYMTGFDILIFAGFAFDPEAQATIQKTPHPNMQIHMANIRPDVEMSDLLKSPKGSQLFTVFGQPDVRIKKVGEELIVELLGVDIYDPVKGEVHASRSADVAAWLLDQNYDGYTFCITQAFFPKEATSRNPWDKLENALHGIIAEEKIEKLRGTASLPFRAGDQKRVAVKVIDQRGNEVIVVKKLEETVEG